MGFFAKQFVLFSAIQSGYYFISIVGIIVSVISASYYLKIVRVLFTLDNISNVENTAHYPLSANIPFADIHENYYISYYVTNIHSFLISTLTLIILLFMLKPSLLLNSTQLLSLSLFYC